MADAQDSKSCVGDYVWVQVPSPAFFNPLRKRQHRIRYDSVLLLCAKHGTNLASESLATGIYRQV